MEYQIPKKVKILKVNDGKKVPLWLCSPTKSKAIKNAIVTMVFFGAPDVNYKMRINVYADANARKLLVSSDPVNAFDLGIIANRFCELRFDFNDKNVLLSGRTYYIEFEFYDGYVSSAVRFSGLVFDFDGAYVNLVADNSLSRVENIPIRSALFFLKD
jgi:hypothetical protein